MTDPYAVLGVSPSSSDEEVRAAYRARSLLLHPDRNADRPPHLRREAQRAMAQLTEAYEAVTRQRSRNRSGKPGPHLGEQAPAAPSGPLPYRLGRLASRARLARDAAQAGEQGGGFAYRLGWLVGRRRSR